MGTVSCKIVANVCLGSEEILPVSSAVAREGKTEPFRVLLGIQEMMPRTLQRGRGEWVGSGLDIQRHSSIPKEKAPPG